jgi:hypothetical protein
VFVIGGGSGVESFVAALIRSGSSFETPKQRRVDFGGGDMGTCMFGEGVLVSDVSLRNMFCAGVRLADRDRPEVTDSAELVRRCGS